MASVAKRRLAAVLAAAKAHPLACHRGIFDRGKPRVLVASVAEGLLAALATGTPEIGFALFNFDGVGGLLCDNGV